MKQGTRTQSQHKPERFQIIPLNGGKYEFTLNDGIEQVSVRTPTENGETQETAYEYDRYSCIAAAGGYEDAVSCMVSLLYTTGDEIALSRTGMDDRKNADYVAYTAYVRACRDFAREYFGVELSAEQKKKEENAKYIPTEYASLLNYAKAKISAEATTIADDEKISLSGLYPDWTPGIYVVGDIRNAKCQTWECFQAHDNATYPDINPDNESTWRTFWRPLHGKSKETARPYAPVTNATDIYKAGEYMIYTDGEVYKALSDTAYSPTDYAPAWELVP